MIRLRQEAPSRRGPATVVTLPVLARMPYCDPDWREQYERECAALCDALIEPPPRTRPIGIKGGKR
jgi:hypothetical protein